MARKRYFGISTKTDRQPIEWRKFSIRFLLVLTAAVALGLGYWRANSYRHPAHEVAAYENAPYTSGRRMTIGPNEIAIRSIARNRYDGKIDLIQGPGLQANIPYVDQLKKCAKWLDVVQLEIEPGPDRVSIIEARIFDHETRTLLTSANVGYGWSVLDRNVIHIYGYGKELPDKLDVWLRVQSHPDNRVYKLAAQPGATVEIPGGVIELKDLTEHFGGWSSATGFTPSVNPATSPVGLTLKWQGDWSEPTRYQMHAVADDGRRVFEDTYLALENPHQFSGPLDFMLPLSSVDHFALQPYGGREPFFFDGVEIPPQAGRKFDPVANATIPVSGQAVSGIIDQYEPLCIRYFVDEGDLLHRQTPEEKQAQGDQVSVILYSPGNLNFYTNMNLFGPSEEPGIPNQLRANSNGITYNASGSRTAAKVFKLPLEQVDHLKIEPAPLP